MLADLAAQAPGGGGIIAWLLDVAGNLGQLAIYVTIGAAVCGTGSRPWGGAASSREG
jgi:hypothetical protein